MPPLIDDTHYGVLLFTVRARRVVCLSSVSHHMGCTDWESAMRGHVGHWQRSTYFDSKLAMVLFAKVRAADVAVAFCRHFSSRRRSVRASDGRTNSAWDKAAAALLYKWYPLEPMLGRLCTVCLTPLNETNRL